MTDGNLQNGEPGHGMIHELAAGFRAKAAALQKWYDSTLANLAGAEPPIYSSVDIRNSGFKISVVDTNLFPAGFNNLCETFSENGVSALKTYFAAWHPDVRKILIFPEEHTRNTFYWKSVSALKKMLDGAGFEVQVGSTSALFTEDPFVAVLDEGDSVSVRKVFLKDGVLRTEDFVPDLVLLNNDLSQGVPDYFKNLKQLLLPSPHLGWHWRKKSVHFSYYQELTAQVAGLLGIDPWLLAPMSEVVTGVDLTDEICLKKLKETADRLIMKIRQKYLQHHIAREPYLFIKNDSGTYGMGVTHIQSGEELETMNRRLRNKLSSAKGGRVVSEYILQEGIPTADLYRGKPLEPVAYLIGGEPIGTFFRINEEKNDMENLNSPGMTFGCLCLHKMEPLPPRKSKQLSYENTDDLFLVSGWLGKIASLATAYELNEARKASVSHTT